ncbi:hypothetical protein [Kitasatospora sp. NPDC089509]|uniref:hypothetical protein n=1 Tax=Kitasatospora sp. NPDC089509 TaxID=3364079 RepID=UPI0038038C4B
MSTENTADEATAARRARFGQLPARIPYSDTVAERPVGPRNPGNDDAYRPELSFPCLALDFAL